MLRDQETFTQQYARESRADERRLEPQAAARATFTGAVAGALGGLAGAAVKLLCEAIVPPRSPDREPPPGVLAARLMRVVNGSELSHERQASVALAVHWTFSIVTSAIYGAAVARVRCPRHINGLGFGVLIWAGFHEVTLPLLEATPPLRELPAKEQINELVSHALFGVTVESVRAAVIRLITFDSGAGGDGGAALGRQVNP